MTPNQLYQRTSEKTDHDIDILKGAYYDHVPEVEGDLLLTDPSGKIEIRHYKDFNFDYRRFWRLASVWFENKPVMIIQNAGREGDDFDHSFITDEAQYHAFIEHLATLRKHKKVDAKIRVVDPNIDTAELTKFYGYELDGFFDRY